MAVLAPFNQYRPVHGTNCDPPDEPGFTKVRMRIALHTGAADRKAIRSSLWWNYVKPPTGEPAGGLIVSIHGLKGSASHLVQTRHAYSRSLADPLKNPRMRADPPMRSTCAIIHTEAMARQGVQGHT
jgi:hypothetical protein